MLIRSSERICNPSQYTGIRPLLQDNTVLWSPNKIADIERVKRVQRKFTKLLHGMYDHERFF